jgi:hypothetical protein
MVKDKNRRKILMEEPTIAYMTFPTNIYLIIYEEIKGFRLQR